MKAQEIARHFVGKSRKGEGESMAGKTGNAAEPNLAPNLSKT